jgi:peptidoglycan/LPS O-acetylase OafA/YrhL
MKGDYRGDVDGLRAIAVLAVILFHFGWGLTGGYVGVDVFFVISGFLITRLVVVEIDQGAFSIAAFWERRVRRIWPAAIATTMAVLVAGWWLLLPRDFNDLAADAIAQLAMLANVRFWRGTNYFATNAELRPLLHTWSLAVEEQFYIFFPLIVVWSRRYGRTALLACIGGLCLASFVASILVMQDDRMAAFFLLPYRAWELLCGALVALLPASLLPAIHVRHATSFAGAALVAGPMLLYDHTTRFPAFAAVPPCIGTALLIAAGPAASLNRLLETPPLRAIGLISYSLYLWHWPVLAILRYSLGLQLKAPVALAAAGFIAALSYLSWRFIEQPFRGTRSDRSLRRTGSIAIAASAGVACLAGLIRLGDGIPSRFPSDILAFAAADDVCRDWSTENPCVQDGRPVLLPIGAPVTGERPCFLLWGDSHGMAISEYLDHLAREHGVSGFACLRGAACPVPGVWRPGDRGGDAARLRDKQHGEEMLAWISSARPRHVVLIARWSEYLAGGKTDHSEDFRVAHVDSPWPCTGETGHRVLREALCTLVGTCQSAGSQLHVLLQVPTQPLRPHQRAIQAALTGSAVSLQGIHRLAHQQTQAGINALLQEFSGDAVHIVDLGPSFFASDGFSRVGARNTSWYWDDDHINTRAVQAVLADVLLHLVLALQNGCESSSATSSTLPALPVKSKQE